MKLRALGLVLALALAAAAAPFSALSQTPAKVVRVGLLDVHGWTGTPRLIRQRLLEAGYVEGKNLVFEAREAGEQLDRLPALAAELVQAKVDVIVALTNPPGFAAKSATSTVPIVVIGTHGAVETGLVKSLARPGGNITGIETLAPELDAKRMELLKEIVPRLSQLRVIYNAADQGSPIHLQQARDAARVLGITVSAHEVSRSADYDAAVGLAEKPRDGLLMFTDMLAWANVQRFADLAISNRLPAMCEFKQFVQAGCLISYGPQSEELWDLAARQIVRVLKGAKPADMPVEQVTRIELAVNLKTAKALGITIPKSVLARADIVVD